MKRSEMVKAIDNFMYTLDGVISSEELSDRLLAFLEEKGMEPPFSDTVYQISCRRDMEPTGNEWEAE